MATIDTSIYGQMLRPVKSIADYDAEYEQAQSNKLQRLIQGQTMSMNKMKMDEAQRGMDEENQIRSIIKGLGAAPLPDVANALQQRGYLKRAMDIRDKVAAQEKDKQEAASKAATTKKTEAEAIAKEWDNFKQNANRVMTPQDALAYTKAMYSHPVLGALAKQFMPEEQAIAQIPQDPQKMIQWKAGNLNLSGEQLLSALKPTMQNLGNKVQGFDPLTAMPIEGTGAPIAQKTGTPPQIVEAINRAYGEGTPEAKKALQDWVKKETRMPGSGGAGGGSVIDLGGENQIMLSKKFGKASAGYRWKPDGNEEPIPGGPADQKAQSKYAGKETVDTVIAGLRSSYDALEKGGGITSTEKGAAENIGAAVSRSGIGQMVGGALGTKNQKERDSIAQARPLLLQAIMKATGMSAKQMDSNVELKLYLATATDPTLSLEANKEALDRIETLYGSGSLKGESAPVKPPPSADKPAASKLSPQDQAALDWANKNPTDPRAAQIKQRLKVK